MKYTKIPVNAFQTLQLNAGILTDSFNPATGAIGNILGATSGGINFTATPTFEDYADDIDNAPKNMKEFKKLTSWEAKMSGDFASVSASLANTLVGASDIDSNDSTHIIPRNDLVDADFTTVWWVGDYSDKNGDTNGGYMAIKLTNALSTGGFQIQSTDKAKGKFSFEFTGHYSVNAQDTVPFEMYVKAGDDEVPVVYTYTEAELTDGFEYGITYYTRSGSSGSYTYTEVEVGAEYDSETTYYTRSIAS